MKKIVIIAAFALIATGCYNDKADKLYPTGPAVVCDTASAISYASDLTPIFATNCSLSGCHDAATAGGGYDFSKIADIQRAVANNRLIGDINWQSGYIAMPLGKPKLSDCEINKITRWALRGAKNN